MIVDSSSHGPRKVYYIDVGKLSIEDANRLVAEYTGIAVEMPKTWYGRLWHRLMDKMAFFPFIVFF